MFDRIAAVVTWTGLGSIFLGILFMALAVLYAIVTAMIG